MSARIGGCIFELQIIVPSLFEIETILSLGADIFIINAGVAVFSLISEDARIGEGVSKLLCHSSSLCISINGSF